MKKKRGKIRKLFILLAIFVINGLVFLNSVQATSIDTAKLCSIGDCGKLLKYRGIVVKTSYVKYSNNGVDYPAYCMDKTKQRSRNSRI